MSQIYPGALIRISLGSDRNGIPCPPDGEIHLLPTAGDKIWTQFYEGTLGIFITDHYTKLTAGTELRRHDDLKHIVLIGEQMFYLDPRFIEKV